MAFRVNGAAAMVKTEVSASVGTVNASAVGTKNIAVSGCTPDMCIDAVFASSRSDGLYILGCQVLSANNVQVALWNTTGGNITAGGTTFRFVSK